MVQKRRTARPVSRSRRLATSGRPRTLAKGLRDDWFDRIGPVEAAASTNPAVAQDPQGRRLSQIKIAVYTLVRDLRQQRRLNLIQKIVWSLDREPTTITFDANPFHWALYALKYGPAELLDTRDDELNRIGYELIHADRHGIEPELLIGFIYQTASSTTHKQKLIKNGVLEPWLSQLMRRRDRAAKA
jgi:hypothetical protein